ncbi:MAG: response regulator [Sedimentisphaerales bacterium]|nr:response regulator [Sedimentisphaerales bacterium]
MAKKVLIIDDDIDLVESMANLLEAKGYEVYTASNGEEGVETAKAETPDLILLDVMMTTKDEGFNVARQLNEAEQLKGTPVVMVSGVRKEMNLPFGFEPDETWLPVKAFLEKPVKPEVLLKTVAEHVK